MAIEYGTCPVCNGSGQVLLTANEKSYSWNKDKTHRDCSNCGGQYM
jgi:DnaJ-class molecular chaperone